MPISHKIILSGLLPAAFLTGTYAPRHGVYVPQGLSRGGDVNSMRWKVPTPKEHCSSTFLFILGERSHHFLFTTTVKKITGELCPAPLLWRGTGNSSIITSMIVLNCSTWIMIFPKRMIFLQKSLQWQTGYLKN